jgi:hypothetical protein
MADDRDTGALTLLTVVSVIAAGALLVTMFGLAPNTDGASVVFGLGGLCVGILIAATWQMHRQRRRTELPQRLSTLVERLEGLEVDQQRMAELEERVDFAERLLARAQDDALLPHARQDGQGA